VRITSHGRHLVASNSTRSQVRGGIRKSARRDGKVDGGKGPAECCGVRRVAAGQNVNRGDKALAVGAHRLMHRDQNATVLGERDGLSVTRLDIRHACSSMPIWARTCLPACPGRSGACAQVGKPRLRPRASGTHAPERATGNPRRLAGLPSSRYSAIHRDLFGGQLRLFDEVKGVCHTLAGPHR
jgi:hypothetical protein